MEGKMLDTRDKRVRYNGYVANKSVIPRQEKVNKKRTRKEWMLESREEKRLIYGAHYRLACPAVSVVTFFSFFLLASLTIVTLNARAGDFLFIYKIYMTGARQQSSKGCQATYISLLFLAALQVLFKD